MFVIIALLMIGVGALDFASDTLSEEEIEDELARLRRLLTETILAMHSPFEYPFDHPEQRQPIVVEVKVEGGQSEKGAEKARNEE